MSDRDAAPSPESRNELLHRLLSHHDLPCPMCGYNLRGLTGTTCPECAQELELRVGLVEPRMRGYVAGLVGLASGFGFSSLLGLYFLWIIHLHRGIPEWFLTVVGIGAAVEGAAVAAWVWAGSRIRRMKKGTRVALVAGAWLLTFLNLLAFTAFIR